MYQQRNLIDLDYCPLTLLAADFHALTLAVRGKVREYTARKAGCGLKCGGSLEKFDHIGCWLRMFLLCEAEAATGYSLTWKRKVTPAGRAWWVLGRSARRTDGIGPGLSGDFPTPQASDAVGGKGVRLQATETGMMPDGSKATIGLRDKVLRSWPTATVADASGHSQTAENPTPGQTGGTTLVGAVKAQAARGNQNKHFGPAGQAVQANPSTTGKPRGSLNAAWVRSLLGWPDEYWIALEKATMEYHLTAPRAARTKASCG